MPKGPRYHEFAWQALVGSTYGLLSCAGDLGVELTYHPEGSAVVKLLSRGLDGSCRRGDLNPHARNRARGPQNVTSRGFCGGFRFIRYTLLGPASRSDPPTQTAAPRGIPRRCLSCFELVNRRNNGPRTSRPQ
jgi:hypothetical protein